MGLPDYLLSGQSFSAPDTVYIGLVTAGCSDSSVGTEVWRWAKNQAKATGGGGEGAASWPWPKDELKEIKRELTGVKRLNLGAGSLELPGYEPRDGAKGDCLFPLPDADGSVDAIRASHVLEHFPHAKTMDVLRDWVRVLKPGGLLRVAVPDFKKIAQAYIDCEPGMNPEPYLMGGQVDARDFHMALFDEESLREQLRAAGIRGIRFWHSELDDCARLPISLNLEGVKPSEKTPKVAAVLSAPRYGPVNGDKAMHQLRHYRIPVNKYSGAFWGQCLTRGIEQTILEEKPEYILTLDFDSLFGPDQIEHLLDLATRYPQADAIAPIQCQRGHELPMFSLRDADGTRVIGMDRVKFQALELQPVRTAHFGLTLLKVEALERTPRPWFLGKPDAQGGWGDGRTDDDMHFWQQWHAAGNSLYLATRLAIGHLVERVLWPDLDMRPLYQDPAEFWNTGEPERVWR